MNIREIAAAMEIQLAPFVERPPVIFKGTSLSDGWLCVGDPPTRWASLSAKNGQFCVFYDSHETPETLADPILHEVCHAVCGHSGFQDEGDSGLMAVQWALMQELQGGEYRGARNEFALYTLCWDGDTDEIGDADDFRHSPAWKHLVQRAVEAELLMPDGRIIWGLGCQIGQVEEVNPFWQDEKPSLAVRS